MPCSRGRQLCSRLWLLPWVGGRLWLLPWVGGRRGRPSRCRRLLQLWSLILIRQLAGRLMDILRY
jgi:hypothetical protein